MDRGSVARLLGIGLVAGALAGGCATPAPTSAPSSPASPSAAPSPSAPPSSAPSSPPPVVVSPKPSKPVKGGGTTMVLTGTVVRVEVEGGCLGLRADGADGFKTYELLGGDKSVLSPGSRVRVSGRVRTDVATTCQIGTPFEVASAERI